LLQLDYAELIGAQAYALIFTVLCFTQNREPRGNLPLGAITLNAVAATATFLHRLG
jgi:hypothetical protein